MKLHQGDCLDVMAGMEPESVDAVVTDPPYDLLSSGGRKGSQRVDSPNSPAGRRAVGFMDKAWDGTGIAFRPETWAAALRVAKPSAYLLAFGGTRTVHRMTCAIEDAGWIIRDMLVWAYACLSDDTEILTEEGWVRYNSPNVGQLAAAFDPESGELRWQPIEAVHRYHHEGRMAEVGPSLVTLNHRVVIDAATARVPRLSDVWHDVYSPVGMGQEGEGLVLLPTMQRRGSATGPALPHWDSGRLDGGVATLGIGEDDRATQSGLEGRRYRVQEARELLWRPVHSVPRMGASDGEARRLRHGAPAGHGDDVRLPDDPDRVREPRRPRSDEQRSGEPDALAGQPDAQALRVWQVSGRDDEPDTVRLVPYAGVVWCITVPTGAFLARRGGVVFVTGNSGFPKSKASLKPAWEPIVMARKPGPLRMLAIDECRIPSADAAESYAIRTEQAAYWTPSLGTLGPRPHPVRSAARDGVTSLQPQPQPHEDGRWPANVVLTDPIFDGGWEGVVGGGDAPGGILYRENGSSGGMFGRIGEFPPGTANAGYGDSGTYSRFFLIPKADRADREPVLGGLPDGFSPTMGNGIGGREHDPANVRAYRQNVHPTVKPTDLMRHLVRLVTPSGGIVLDPFLGSGTTAIAAEMEGFKWIGIEREAEYVAIAEARLNGVQRGMGLDA